MNDELTIKYSIRAITWSQRCSDLKRYMKSRGLSAEIDTALTDDLNYMPSCGAVSESLGNELASVSVVDNLVEPLPEHEFHSISNIQRITENAQCDPLNHNDMPNSDYLSPDVRSSLDQLKQEMTQFEV